MLPQRDRCLMGEWNVQLGEIFCHVFLDGVVEYPVAEGSLSEGLKSGDGCMKVLKHL